MASSVTVDVGHGTTVNFATTGFSAEVTHINIANIARSAAPTSFMQTPAAPMGTAAQKTFLASRLSDPGSLVLDVHFNANVTPPIDAAPESITITFPMPQGYFSGVVWTFLGFVISLAITDSLEEAMVGKMAVKLTSNIDATAAVPFGYTEEWDFTFGLTTTLAYSEEWV